MARRLALLLLAAPAAAIALTGVLVPLRMALATRAEPAGWHAIYLRELEPARGAVSDAVIGYRTDRPVDTSLGRRTEARYYLAQYALAPVLVDASRRPHRVTLVNEPGVARFEAIVAQPNVTVVLPLGPQRALVEVRPGRRR